MQSKHKWSVLLVKCSLHTLLITSLTSTQKLLHHPDSWLMKYRSSLHVENPPSDSLDAEVLQNVTSRCGRVGKRSGYCLTSSFSTTGLVNISQLLIRSEDVGDIYAVQRGCGHRSRSGRGGRDRGRDRGGGRAWWEVAKHPDPPSPSVALESADVFWLNLLRSWYLIKFKRRCLQ